MVNIANIVTILLEIIAPPSLIIAIYSYRKQRIAEKRQKKAKERAKELDRKVTETQEMYEDRLRREEDLRKMADSLQSVIDWMETFSENMYSRSDPSTTIYASRNALWPCLHQLCKDILTYKYEYGEVPYIEISVFQFLEEGEKNPIKDANKAVDLYSQYESPTISVVLRDEKGYADDLIFCHLNDSFEEVMKFKYQKEQLLKEYEELLDQFSPGILSQLETQVDTILRRSINNSIQTKSPVKYDLNTYGI